MKSALSRKHYSSSDIEINAFLVSILPVDPGENKNSAIVTMLMALQRPDNLTRYTEGSLVVVKVEGLLAHLCKEELRFADQIKVGGKLRMKYYRSTAGVLRIVEEISASMVIPVHLELERI